MTRLLPSSDTSERGGSGSRPVGSGLSESPTPPAVCDLCNLWPSTWQSPTGYHVCTDCQIYTLRADVRYWRALAYKYWDLLEALPC